MVSNFEDENADEWYFSNRLSIQPNNTDEHDGWHSIVERPYDDQDGYVLAASEGTSWYNIYDAVIDLGEMSETEEYTIYYEIAYPDDSTDIVVGIGDMEAPDDWSDEEPGFDEYSMLARFGVKGFDVRDEDGTGYTDDHGEQQLQTWYKVWIVAHPEFYSWSMWIQGGAFTEQTQVADFHYWRKNDSDGVGPMRSLVLRVGGNSSSATTTGAPTYFDNVYVDTASQNLETPPVEGKDEDMWGPYELVEGWANTDSLMGWLYPKGDYVYISGLEKYVYLPVRNLNDSGAWVFAGGSYDESNKLPDGWLETESMGWVWVGDSSYLYSLALEEYIYVPKRDATSTGIWLFVRS